LQDIKSSCKHESSCKQTGAKNMLLQTSDNLVAIVTRRDDVSFQPLHYSDEKIIFTSGRVFLKTILGINADTKLDVLLIYIDDCMRRYIDSTDV